MGEDWSNTYQCGNAQIYGTIWQRKLFCYSFFDVQLVRCQPHTLSLFLEVRQHLLVWVNPRNFNVFRILQTPKELYHDGQFLKLHLRFMRPSKETPPYKRDVPLASMGKGITERDFMYFKFGPVPIPISNIFLGFAFPIQTVSNSSFLIGATAVSYPSILVAIT